ncbi:MAG: Hsp20/alpha crystallin family protein [Candidatus Nealsonbacteria bacterium]
MGTSFFEKLKKGMDIEETPEKKLNKEKIENEEIKQISIELEEKKQAIRQPAEKKLKKKEKVEIKKSSATLASKDKEWPKTEGQLAVDIYQTESELVIQSAIAGVKPEELNISVEGDLITIRGERKRPAEEGGDYFSQECYWGPFSRKIILPVEVDPGRIDAILKEGILIIRMPKISREKKRKVTVKKL